RSDTIRGLPASRSSSPCRKPGGKFRAQAFRGQAVTPCSARHHRCAPKRRAATRRSFRASPNARTHLSPELRESYRARASKSVSSPEPFLQPEVRDLPLLLHSLVKFRPIIILHPALYDLQNLGRRLARGAHDKNTVELPLVLSIRLRQRGLHGVIGNRNSPLLLCGPLRRAHLQRVRRARITDPRVTSKRLRPIGFAQLLPNFVGRSQQRSLVRK